MSLTPLDIQNKDFKKVFRGYEEAEVDEFLDIITDRLKEILQQNQDLQLQKKQIEDQLNHFRSMEQTLHNAIVVAQETADDVKESAHKEHEIIIREAKLQAESIVQEALARARSIDSEAENIKNSTRVYRSRLRNLLKAQLDMLGEDEWDQIESDMSDHTLKFDRSLVSGR